MDLSDVPRICDGTDAPNWGPTIVISITFQYISILFTGKLVHDFLAACLALAALSSVVS